MAQVESVYNATQTEAFFDDQVAAGATGGLNPALTEPGVEYHITLIFDDHDSGSYDLSDIYDMLNAQYATVTCDQIPTRNSAIVRITGGLA